MYMCVYILECISTLRGVASVRSVGVIGIRIMCASIAVEYKAGHALALEAEEESMRRHGQRTAQREEWSKQNARVDRQGEGKGKETQQSALPAIKAEERQRRR